MRRIVWIRTASIDGLVHGVKGYEDWGLQPGGDEVVWKVASLRAGGTR
jgi:hypothetical protein